MNQRTLKTWMTILSTMAVMVIGFQNCSDKQFSQTEDDSQEKLGINSSISIVEGNSVMTPIVVTPSAVVRNLTWTVQNSSVDLAVTSGTLMIPAGNAGANLTLTAKTRPGLQGQRVYLLSFQENGMNVDDLGRSVVVTDAPEAPTPTPTPNPTPTPTPTPPGVVIPKILAQGINCTPNGDCIFRFTLQSAATYAVSFDWRTNDNYPNTPACPLGYYVENNVQYTCGSPNVHYLSKSGVVTFPAGSPKDSMVEIRVKSITNINMGIQVLMSNCKFNNNLINCRPDYFN